MSGEPKVLLCNLFERTSAAGNRYMFGRLGAAKVIAFIDQDAEPQYGAEAVWNVYLQQPDKKANGAAPQQRRRAKPKPPADDGEPMPADGVEDLWR